MEKKLTQLQNEVAEVLLSEGYALKYTNSFTYFKHGHLDIDVEKIKTVRDLFRVIYDCGRVDKMWSIKRALEII